MDEQINQTTPNLQHVSVQTSSGRTKCQFLKITCCWYTCTEIFWRCFFSIRFNYNHVLIWCNKRCTL